MHLIENTCFVSCCMWLDEGINILTLFVATRTFTQYDHINANICRHSDDCIGYRPARNIIETLNTLHLTLYINQTINQMMFNNNQSINQLHLREIN